MTNALHSRISIQFEPIVMLELQFRYLIRQSNPLAQEVAKGLVAVVQLAAPLRISSHSGNFVFLSVPVPQMRPVPAPAL